MKRKDPVTKICIICGKEFLSYAPNAQQPGICSEQCRRINRKIIRDRLFTKHPEKKLEYRETEYWKRYYPVHCRICGGLIESEPDRKKRPIYHDVCVYDQILEIIKKHGKLTDCQRNMLYLRGYTVKSFKADYADELAETELKT